MLADSPYRHELEADVEPFRSILLGLFFLAVGMMLDLGAIATRPLFVVSMALALIAAKAAILFLIGLVFKMNWRSALALGLLLSQGGEFGFVLFAQAQDALLIEPQAASMFSAIVTVSMMTTPFLLLLARRFEFAVRDDDSAGLDGPERAPRGRAIVVGYGRFGQTVSQMLMGQGCQVTLIDRKPAQIERSSQNDIKVYYGDGTQVDLLRRAGADAANLLIFAHDDRAFTPAVIQPVLDAFPHLAVMVRAFDRAHLIELTDLPLAAVVREVYESAIVMGRAALAQLGLQRDELDEIERQYRDNDHARLDVQIASGLLAAKHLLFRPGRTMVLPARQALGDDA
jgi:CPA2 family monovalent cation:H+ antiporter-2